MLFLSVKGAKHIGAVFPASAVSGPCSPLKLVTHISLPKEDPVTTQVVTTDIDVSGLGRASNTPSSEKPGKTMDSNDARDGESKGGERVRQRAKSHNG